MRKKITVVGAGFVGTTCVQRIVEKDLANVVLIDIVEGLAQGKALDIMESAPLEGFKAKVSGTNEYYDTKDSDIVVITAGLSRKPGMSRDDLLKSNAKIVRDIVINVTQFNPEAILIIVTNPLDIMSYLAYKVSKFPSKRVIGMAGVLDSARYRYFIAEALNKDPSKVEAMVLGGHGDSMVPLSEHTKIEDVPVTKLIDKEKLNQINERTKKGGAEIVKLLKTGSAYYAPSASVVEMLKSIIFNENKILPCSVYLNGEYGIRDVYCGVPVKLSEKGVEEIINIELSSNEKELLKASNDRVKEGIEKIREVI